MESHTERYLVKHFGAADDAESYVRSQTTERKKNVEARKRQQRNPSRIAQIAHKFNKNNFSLFCEGFLSLFTK